MIEIPLDDDGLQRIEDAMAGAWAFDDDGNRYLKGGDYTLTQLLDWYSGYDPSKLIPYDTDDTEVPKGLVDSIQEFIPGVSEAKIFKYPDPIYSEHDLIRALVKEVRRLRATGTEHD